MGDIHSHTLSCGMPVVVEPMEGVRSAALSWVVPAGSAHDPENRLGIAAMTEELLLRGAGARASRPLADALDALGISRSVDASTHHMRLSATMVGTKLIEALDVLVDIIRSPRFDDDAIEPTRDLCLQAIASLADEPHERATIAAKARHHPSPINRSGLGTPEGLRAISREDIAGAWSLRARPKGSVLGVAGAVDPARVIARLEALLSGWSGAAPEFTTAGEPARGYAHEQDQTNQVQIIVMHDAPHEAHPDCPLERVAVSILSGGMSGRLFTEVREKRGLCYSVHARYGTERAYGRVTADVGTTPERAQESLDVLMSELRRMGAPGGGATREEFDRAMVGIKSRLIFSGESTGARAASLVSDHVRLGRARSLGDLARAYDAVTLDALNAYLSRRSLGRVTIQTLGPAALRPPL